MTFDAVLVNCAVAVAFGSGLTRNWFVSQGRLRPVYWLMIVMSGANMLLNTTIAFERPDYSGLYLFNILIVHSIYSAIVGLRRLRVLEQSDD